MKLLDEIHAYQGKLTFEELNEKIQQINLRKNMGIHSGTGKSPITLLNIEKDSLCTAPQKLDIKNLTFGVFFNEINL